LSTRQEIIVQALWQRHAEVCKSTSEFVANSVGGTSDFVSQLRNQSDAQQTRKWKAPEKWYASTCDCLAAIRALALNEQLECAAVGAPDDSSFIKELQASAKDPQHRFDLLATRYRNPLNIAAPSEEHVREHLLERLMVADRSRIERHSLNRLNPDDFLLRLNLIAINGSLTEDLRYLDALNYLYEVLPSDWYPQSPQNWLRMSFMMFYARALTVHFTHID
jgi:hypothetical protein